MTTEITTPTISEKELFSEFLRYGYFAADPFTGRTLAIHMPKEVFEDPGRHGLNDGRFADWACDLSQSDFPGSDIDCMLSDLRHFASRLEELRNTFADLQARREVDGGTADMARYAPRDSAWPRVVKTHSKRCFLVED